MKSYRQDVIKKERGKLLILTLVALISSFAGLPWVLSLDGEGPARVRQTPSGMRTYLTVNLPKVNSIPCVTIPCVDATYGSLDGTISVRILDHSRYLLADEASVTGEDLEGNLAELLKHSRTKMVLINANSNLPYDQLVKAVDKVVHAGAVVVGVAA